MKNKKGFTMVEMLGVVILLAAIMLLAFPSMLEQFRKSKEDINESTLQLIYTGADEYMNQNLDAYPKMNGEIYCISLRFIVDSGYLTDSITDVLNDKDFDLDSYMVRATYLDNKYSYSLVQDGTCAMTFYQVMTRDGNVTALDPDGNLRYVGPTPNNYVSFNGELWRIIGVFDGQTKIIRNEYYSTRIEWDASYNNWAEADLQATLNGTYLTSIQTNDPTSYSYIDLEHVWNIGGTPNYNSSTRSDFYNAERSNTISSSMTSSTWTGAIGLMYPSDYGYASSGTSTSCDTVEMYNWENYSDCYSNSWLYDSSNYQWTLTPHSDVSSVVYSVGFVSYVSYGSVSNSIGARPVLFLKSDVGIASGTGKIGDPFILSQ